ncbi:MAG: Fic family protein [Akkermansiaceae bacterium]|jgi:Fic family protein|nr:Fic family protein [Akkermansiaceae bacterium]
MQRGPTGHYLPISTVGETARAFVPAPLPPVPALEIDGELGALLDAASTALGRLDGISLLLPDPGLFLYTYVRKEAVLSSQIEGTQSSLSDLLSHELDNTPSGLLEDVSEVSCYVDAMQHGLALLKNGTPLSLRLIREIHARLLDHGRGSGKMPGEFRTSQNWIGGSRPGNARFVPPPPDAVLETMGALELFLHDQPVKTRPLLKAALAHVQFETIHPFLDGNGRLGRLLITFILCAEGVLDAPMLYLSLYLKKHRDDYYRLLQEVRVEGNWEDWLTFFLTGVLETSAAATQTARSLLRIFQRDSEILRSEAASVIRLHQHLQRKPVISIAEAARSLNISAPTAAKALATMESHSIVREITGQQYRKLYTYREYLDVLNEDTI